LNTEFINFTLIDRSDYKDKHLLNSMERDFDIVRHNKNVQRDLNKIFGRVDLT